MTTFITIIPSRSYQLNSHTRWFVCVCLHFREIICHCLRCVTDMRANEIVFAINGEPLNVLESNVQAKIYYICTTEKIEKKRYLSLMQQHFRYATASCLKATLRFINRNYYASLFAFFVLPRTKCTCFLYPLEQSEYIIG